MGVVKKAQTRQPRSAPRLPDNLPVKEEIIDPDAVRFAPNQWRLIGEEVSEQLDYEPARFCKRRLIRRKYVRKDAPFAAPVIAPLPPCLQERCLATPELIAHVVISKYADHLPLYRQEHIYRRRHGIDLSRQTLCRWTALAAQWCEPLYREMIRRQSNAPFLQVDETPIPYQKPGAGKTPQGYLWVSRSTDGSVVYHWHPGRSAKCLESIIVPEFSGTLQCDGFSAYASFKKQHSTCIKLAGCWAHVRRKFFQAQDRAPPQTAWILGQIGQLYRIEAAVSNSGPTLRCARRAAQSAPILKRLHKVLVILRQRYLPKSDLGRAIDYALAQWPQLQRFISEGRIDIDNNAVERAIRPTKIGVKNWLFVGAETAGKTTAVLFSIIESAKQHGLEPYAYLLHLLKTLPTATNRQIPSLMPAAIAKANRAYPATRAAA